MKRCVVCLLVAAMFLSLGVFSRAGAAEPIKLKAANYLPVTHPMSLLTAWFCDEVKKRTNGQVEITYYPGGTLLNPVKMYDGVVTGIADMGVSHISYTRGRFPVMEVFEQPLGFPSGWVATQVTTDFYNKYTPKEWSDVQVLYINTSGPLILQTVNKPVKTLQDLKGIKVRATGRMSDVVKSLGAVPIPLEMGDVYDSLRRNVIEGVTVDLSTLKYWKFADVVKYVTADWQLGTGYTFYFVINKKKWDPLPNDVKKVFTDVAFEAKEKQASLWNEMDVEGAAAFKAVGGQMINLSTAEADKWIKAVQPVFAEYKKDMVSKGFKAAEIDGWISYIKERIKYWSAEEKKRKIPSPF